MVIQEIGKQENREQGEGVEEITSSFPAKDHARGRD